MHYGSDEIVIGCDECGWGPLAGPIVVGACALRVADFANTPCRDSKKYSGKNIASLFSAYDRDIASSKILASSVYESWPLESVQKGAGAALRDAYRLAIETVRYRLRPRHPKAIIDGSTLWYNNYCETMIKGDSKCKAISAASCIAKRRQLEVMHEWHLRYPEYGFNRHHGYGTDEHIAAIRKHGMLSGFHRITIVARMPLFGGITLKTRT